MNLILIITAPVTKAEEVSQKKKRKEERKVGDVCWTDFGDENDHAAAHSYKII